MSSKGDVAFGPIEKPANTKFTGFYHGRLRMTSYLLNTKYPYGAKLYCVDNVTAAPVNPSFQLLFCNADGRLNVSALLRVFTNINTSSVPDFFSKAATLASAYWV